MTVLIRFQTCNSAFEDDFKGECAFILDQCKRIVCSNNARAGVSTPLRDSNGNAIGDMTLMVQRKDTSQ